LSSYQKEKKREISKGGCLDQYTVVVLTPQLKNGFVNGKNQGKKRKQKKEAKYPRREAVSVAGGKELALQIPLNQFFSGRKSY